MVLIDGGLGQLSSALSALEEIQLEDRICLLSMAKGVKRQRGKEKIYISSQKDSLDISPDSKAFKFLAMIRDEAHDFAIKRHRASRRKQMLRSPLEQINGIGDKKKQMLIAQFGSLDALSSATPSQIAKVRGINIQMASKILDVLNADK